MKKFYALIASVATASLISASAINPFVKSEKQARLHSLENLVESEQMIKESGISSRFTSLSKQSRADEEYIEIDPTKFTQAIYYDFDAMYYEGDTRRENPIEKPSGCEVAFTEKDDYTLSVSGLAGYERLSFDITFGESIYIELGQLVAELPNYDLVLGTYDVDANTNKAIFITEGIVDCNLYLYALEIKIDRFCYLAIDRETQQCKGYYICVWFPCLYLPNATLQYTVFNNDGTQDEVSNKIYIDTYYFEEDNKFSLSNVMPFNEGFAVEVVYNEDVEAYVIEDQVVYPSLYYGTDNLGVDVYTGDFYATAFSVEEDPTAEEGFNVVEYKIMPVDLDLDNEMISFPMDMEEFGLSYDAWGIVSYDGKYAMGTCSKAKILLGEETDKTIPVTIETTVAAPIYYNLQGMKVANPQAGHIYIKKEGSKISKVLVK